MAQLSVTLTDAQQVAYGVSPKTKGGAPDTAVAATFKSSDDAVAEIRQMDPADPQNVLIGTVGVGSATITASAPGYPDDTLVVTVTVSGPGKLNATVGEPSDEP